MDSFYKFNQSLNIQVRVTKELRKQDKQSLFLSILLDENSKYFVEDEPEISKVVKKSVFNQVGRALFMELRNRAQVIRNSTRENLEKEFYKKSIEELQAEIKEGMEKLRIRLR